MVDPYHCQLVWDNLVEELGEEAARKELARLLRMVATCVEKGSGPMDIFGCDLPENREFCKGEIMSTISVTLSLPWPG